MEGGESSHQSISTQFEGCWLSENGNHKIDCNLNDDRTWLICTWPNEYVEIYELDSENLKGLTNSKIIGYPSKDSQLSFSGEVMFNFHGQIFWNSGNRWTKEGNYMQSRYTNILEFYLDSKFKNSYSYSAIILFIIFLKLKCNIS